MAQVDRCLSHLEKKRNSSCMSRMRASHCCFLPNHAAVTSGERVLHPFYPTSKTRQNQLSRT